jgi:hypothetical protein
MRRREGRSRPRRSTTPSSWESSGRSTSASFFEDCPEQLKEAYRKVCWLSLTIQLFLPMAIQSEQGVDEWDLYATYFHLCKFVRSG